MQVTFEFDLTLYRIDRDVYSMLDLIGDLGGLAEGLTIILAIILSFATFNNFDHFLIEYLYGKHDESQKIVPLRDNKTRLCRQKCNGCLPKAYCSRKEKRCCLLQVFRLSREERLFAKARQRFGDEIDLVDLLKNIRAILKY